MTVMMSQEPNLPRDEVAGGGGHESHKEGSGGED